jgi:hypothetical protein
MSISSTVAEVNKSAIGGELFTNHIFGRKCMTKNDGTDCRGDQIWLQNCNGWKESLGNAVFEIGAKEWQ